MDPFEPAAYIPIPYNELPHLDTYTILLICIFLMICLLYLVCILGYVRRGDNRRGDKSEKN